MNATESLRDLTVCLEQTWILKISLWQTWMKESRVKEHQGNQVGVSYLRGKKGMNYSSVSKDQAEDSKTGQGFD